MKRKFILFTVFIIFIIPAFGQNKFAGRITDSKNKEPLAFVNIIYNSKNLGTTTDLDGYFSIDSYEKIEYLKISYLGYITKTITKDQLGNRHYIEIQLEPEAFQLSEVVILPGVNPAHRIIDEVIKNADRNNPEKMRSFSYVSYNRMHINIGEEYLLVRRDTLQSNDSLTIVQDTITQNTSRKDRDKAFIKFLGTQHLFLTESITERKYRYPDNNKEVVMAQRVSGIKNPGFVMLTGEFQSISFYKDYIELMDKKYLSPISKGSTKRYFYQIEDTMYNERADTIFIISYRPLRGKNFDGLQGVMHINSNGYALQNVRSKPYEESYIFDVNIQQKYEYINDTQWFPVQLNTDIVMYAFRVYDDSVSIPMVATGKTYITDISLNPDHKRREFNQLDVSVKDDAHKKDENFWDSYRKEPLSDKDKRTYEKIDSIGEKINIDKFLNAIEIIASGNIPWKFINFDVTSVYWYNNYESSRLGLGISTNDRLLKWASVGGYFAYGFRDKAWKYGGNINFLLHRPSNTRLEFGYKRDLELSDDYLFHTSTALSLENTFMDMFLREMDSITNYYASFQFSTLKYLQAKLKFSYSEKNIINTNRYDYKYPIEKHYFTTEAGIYMRYAYKEKFKQTPRGNRISLGTKFPVIYLNVIKGLPVFNSDSDYLKVEAAISKKFTIRNAGETNVLISGGFIDGIAPYSELYYIAGLKSWLNFDNSFNTMSVNEFISDRFATVSVRHNFGSLLWKKEKFSPEFVLITSAGWGDSKLVRNSSNDNHAKLMNKGYYESGIQINNIFKVAFIGYGLGVYYRYGPYAFEKEIKNWAFKLTINFRF